MTQTLVSQAPYTEGPIKNTSDIGESVACPECGQQAAVEWRTHVDSTDGPLEHLKIRCPDRHWFLMPAFMSADVAP